MVWQDLREHEGRKASDLPRRNRELYSNIELGKGEASLWNIEFRGEVTAALIYDGMPFLDHFKRVDDTTLMGIQHGKELPDDSPFYFILERVA
ncbi:DUF4334 domain-containing protein [Streptomyces sirii]|uniref:DUF4334 domain-containing protein n=1 Tax=Streptomyces sirii TaxID=3127701 RepID=UPI003D35B2D4